MFNTNTLNLPHSANNGRRHSSHCCLVTDDERNDQNVVKKLVKPQVLPLVPPPVPKRTFQGKLKQQKRVNNFCSSFEQNLENLSDQNRSYSQYRQEKFRTLNSGRVRNLSNYQLSRIDSEAESPLGPFKDNKFRFTSSVSSASFDDIDPDDIVLFNKKMQLLDSNQSSSDSNKSQTTIDTGYVSNDNEKSLYTTASSIRSFRSRFSSEDTQSSLDSYMSSDLHQTDTTDSLPNNSTSNSPFIMKKNIFNFDTKVNLASNKLGYNQEDGRLCIEMNKSPTRYETNRNRRMPAVPVRKNIGVPPKLPPPKHFNQKLTTNNSPQQQPPPPPQRSQMSLDSGRYHQNGRVTGTFQKQHQFNSMKNDTNSFQEMYNRPSGIRTNNNTAPTKPPPFSQIHPTKVNQRQDSNISSDSYSMTSSPGYNSKNMEIPLLQNVSKINNHKIITQHQESNDNLNINAMIKNKNIGNNNNANKKINRVNIRQDSTISSDSISQTSSPGYNMKMMEAPLLANAVKLHSSNDNMFLN
jgi:atrial natriuretic peptide-converting enzyme